MQIFATQDFLWSGRVLIISSLPTSTHNTLGAGEFDDSVGWKTLVSLWARGCVCLYVCAWVCTMLSPCLCVRVSPVYNDEYTVHGSVLDVGIRTREMEGHWGKTSNKRGHTTGAKMQTPHTYEPPFPPSPAVDWLALWRRYATIFLSITPVHFLRLYVV